MKIKKLTLNNFMAFGNAEMNWSDNINIICGENSTGKTTLLKVMYSLIKPLSNVGKDNLTKEMEEQVYVKKIQGVFRPDEMKIGRLVSRKQGSNRTDFSIDLEKKQKISVGFGNRQENHADVFIERDEKTKKYDVIYIPTKEMISTVEHFVSLYDEYHIDFEEMYYDLAKLLDRPLSKGPNTTEQNQVLSNLEDIIDVGGESTRPGYTLLSDDEEISRIVPVIENLKKEFDVPISLDTYKGNVAKEGIKAGADLINDIWGLKYDDILAKVIAENDVACCLMHNRKDTNYKDFLTDVVEDLQETIDIVQNAGIKKDKIILDPGIGFAKTYEQNLIMLKNLSSLHKLNFPLLLGASRKSVVGLTLDLPADERVEGTITTSIMAVLADYDFVRVHDIKENLRAIKMAEAIKYAGGNF